MIAEGSSLGPYLVLGQLGEGGMGTVYRARDTRLGRAVALKLLPADFAREPARLARFRQEALALAALNHPNVATIYGFEEPEKGELFLVLELVDGESLADRLTRGALPVEEALAICAQIAEALEVAHEHGVIHRDIKPGNVMLGPRGIVKVLDFGLAETARQARQRRAAGGDATAATAMMGAEAGATIADLGATIADLDATIADLGATMAGASGGSDATSAGSSTDGGISGTPGYMSPEQVMGGAQDERTDAFAFGCVLYECLTGERAFQGNNAIELLKAALKAEPDLARLPERTPARVRNLLQQCLLKDREQRLGDLKLARTEIEEALGIRRAAALMGGEAPAVAPNNLPRQTSSFVGRQDEIDACVRAMSKTRLLTLTGVGGSGKTRLALKVAEVLLADAPDGAWFIDLAPVTDPERVALTIAAAVGVREEPGQPLITTLCAHFARRTLVLVLDNCEHLVTAVAGLTELLLDSGPDVRVLATSREALNLPGETLHGVPTLTLPPVDPPNAAALLKYEAARLFIERARLVRPDFEVPDAEAGVVAELCHRLDGIPLAIELAAARVRVLGVSEIRARLDDRFRLLTGGSRTALPRQQTLRATIQWSYDQLVDEEKRVLRALAAFTGGWTLETGTQVIADDADEFEVLDHLTRLVDKSLVVVERGSDSASTRYRFLETVRQFALEELNAAGEGPAARDRHLKTFSALANHAEKALLGAEQGAWLKRLEAEHGNLLAALDWCGSTEGGAEKGLAFAGAVSRFWSSHGYFELGWRQLKSALDRDTVRAPTPARAKALVRAGGLALYRGDYAAARPLIEESLAIVRTQGDKKGVARSLSGLATVATYQNDFAAARTYNEESLALYGEMGERRGEALVFHNLGYLALRQNDLARARDMLEQSLAILRALQDREQCAATLADIAVVAVRQDDRARARASLVEALSLVEDLGAKREGAYALEAAAELAAAEDEAGRAARLLSAAEALREAMGSPLVPAEAEERREFMARVEASLGDSAWTEESVAGRGLNFEAAVRYARDGLGAGIP